MKKLLVALLTLLTILTVGWPTGSHAQESVVPLATYASWLREGYAAAQRNDRIGLELIAPQLIGVRQVTLLSGGTAAVDNQWLKHELAANDPDLDLISQRLGALIDVLEQERSTLPTNALDRLRQMLGRPPFAEQQRTPTFLDDLFTWLLNWLERLFSPVSRAGAGSAGGIGWLAAIIGGILTIGIVAYVIFNLRRNMVREANTASDDPEANLTATIAREQAADLARSGDYRTAVRYMYLSALLWLDERDMLRYDRALTNREYLDHLRDDSDLRTRLKPIIETFDRVWYGYAPLDAQSFEAYRRQVEALRQ